MAKTWFLSSTGSGDLSLMLKGLLTAFIPLIILVGKSLGFDLTETAIVEWVGIILTAVSAVQIAWGAIRKLVSGLSGEGITGANK